MTVPVYNMTDTWNNVSTTFTAIQMNVTNTASAAGSALMNLQIGGNSVFSVLSLTSAPAVTVTAGCAAANVYGSLWILPVATAPSSTNFLIQTSFGGGDSNVYLNAPTSGSYQFRVNNSPVSNIFSDGSYNISTSTGSYGINSDTLFFRDAANIFAQRNSTNAQTFRVYNTFTDASNYERGIFDWTTNANTLTIGAQALGTGTARSVWFAGSGAAQPFYFFYNGTAASTSYFYFDSGGAFHGVNSNFETVRMNTNTGFAMSNQVTLTWNSATSIPSGSTDTGISRSAAAVIAFGNGTQGDASATFLAKTKAGAPTTSDVPSGCWILIRDTTNSTTKMYYNNAGTLMTVSLV